MSLLLLKVSPVPALQKRGKGLIGNKTLPLGLVRQLGELAVDGNDCASVNPP